jgi:tetratricopeptide (TPR) repeat protein
MLDKSAPSSTDKPMPQPSDVLPKLTDKSNPFGDDASQPGNLMPLPRPQESKAPAASAGTATGTATTASPAPSNPSANKPLNTEPSDQPSTENDLVPGQADFQQGEDLRAAGKYAQAIEAYKKAIKISKGDPSQFVAIGICYRMLDRYDEAIAAFSNAIDLHPGAEDIAEAYLRRGICWFHKGEYGPALLDFDEASGLVNTDARAPTWKGMTLARQGRMLDAVNTYSIAILNDNRYVLAHVNRGLAYAALQDYRKAIYDFNAALNVTPNDATLYYKRATVQSLSGDYRAAIQSDNEAIRLNPRYAPAYQNRSEAYRQLGNSAKADSDSQRAQQLNLASEHKTASIR